MAGAVPVFGRPGVNHMTKAKGFQIPAAVSAEAKAFFEAAAPIPLRSADAASSTELPLAVEAAQRA